MTDTTGYTARAYAQITPEMDAAIREVMAEHDCDRSTAIRALIHVGLRHRSRVAPAIETEAEARDARHSSASSVGGVLSARTRAAQRAAAQTTALQGVQRAITDAE